MSKRQKRDSPCCVWDITIPQLDSEEKIVSPEEVKAWMKEHCKFWCFQLEKGEKSGYMHYQCRISLTGKSRMNQLISSLYEANLVGHVSVTSTENRDNFFYQTKKDTRIEGPWKDDDKDLYVPVHIRSIVEWRPFQESIIALCSIQDWRRINLLYDPIGNSGKSMVATYMDVHGKAVELDYSTNYKDIMRQACKEPKLGCYFVDMPRAVSKKALNDFYGAIETLKNGKAFDDRYTHKRVRFDPPVIWVFSNEVPELGMLSRDRWVLWTINEDLELVKFVPEEGPMEGPREQESMDLGGLTKAEFRAKELAKEAARKRANEKAKAKRKAAKEAKAKEEELSLGDLTEEEFNDLLLK